MNLRVTRSEVKRMEPVILETPDIMKNFAKELFEVVLAPSESEALLYIATQRLELGNHLALSLREGHITSFPPPVLTELLQETFIPVIKYVDSYNWFEIAMYITADGKVTIFHHPDLENIFWGGSKTSEAKWNNAIKAMKSSIQKDNFSLNR